MTISPSKPVPPRQALLIPLAIALCLGVLASLAARFAAGLTLGLFFGTILLATALLPALLITRSSLHTAYAAAIFSFAAAAGWLPALLNDIIAPMQYLNCAVILLGYVLALVGLAVLCRAMTHSAIAATTITLLLGTAWLTWPIWLANVVDSAQSPAIRFLAPAHPLLAINGVLRDLDFWGTSPLAYWLTHLRDYGHYALPSRSWPSPLLHIALAVACFLFAGILEPRPAAQPFSPGAYAGGA